MTKKSGLLLRKSSEMHKCTKRKEGSNGSIIDKIDKKACRNRQETANGAQESRSDRSSCRRHRKERDQKRNTCGREHNDSGQD